MRKKTIIALSILYVLLMAVTFIIQHLNGDGSKWTDMLGRTATSLLPLLLLFMKRIPFPVPLIISYYALIFCTFFLGATIKFYDRIHWWDTAMHYVGSAFMAFVAVSLYKMLIPKQVEKSLSSWLLFLFVLCFAVFSSSIWEALEFAGSELGKMEADSQKDTMTDMISGLVGALTVATISVIRRITGYYK